MCAAAAAVEDLEEQIAGQISVGPDPWNRTYYPKGAHADNSKKPWYIIDAEGQTLGRLASLAAMKIRCLRAHRPPNRAAMPNLYHLPSMIYSAKAYLLLLCRGKTVPEYTPSMDMGGFVIVVNAEKVIVTGDKFNQKMYYRHTGRPGSLKQETFRNLQAVSQGSSQ